MLADLIRTKGDDFDSLNFQILRRTGYATTVAENLTGATCRITIWASEGGGGGKVPAGSPLSTFNNTTIPGGDIIPLEGLIDYALSGSQVTQLVAGDYVGKIVVEFSGGKFRAYPNDVISDQTVSYFWLQVLPGIS
jgi:hypothetical protein